VARRTTGDIPEPSLGRMHRYQLALRRLRREGVGTVPSRRLGELTGVSGALVRRDLSHLGAFGQPGIGYEVEALLASIQSAVRSPEPCPLAIIGAGNLGAALAGYVGFDMPEYRLIGIFDANPARVGHRLQGMVVRHLRELAEVVRETGLRVGILTVPAGQAAAAAEVCAAAGLRALLSFAPLPLPNSAPLLVRQVDLSEELQILSYQAGCPSPGQSGGT
jgi:redox-sensing transcriptional repressor